MNIYVDRKPENCNRCIFNQNAYKYLDVEDYCVLNKKNIFKIDMDRDCPLKELKGKSKCITKILKAMRNKRKYKNVERMPDLIQMDTDIVLTDKDGNLIEIKTPEPEYITDPMW